MGDTIHKVAMEMSDIDNSYKLGVTDQAILALSQTKEDKSTIFVGNKRGTINALVSLVKTRLQWTDYIDEVMSLVIINGERNVGSMSTFDCTTYSFRISDVPLPEFNNFLLIYANEHQTPIVCLHQRNNMH